MKKVLSIAGSDCSGGAGIQADLKTIAAHSLYGMTAITALTAQNTTGVMSVLNITPEFLALQLDAIFTDIVPDAVKIGMVSNTALIEVISDKLMQYSAQHIVVDPVMISTSGSSLLNDHALGVLTGRLFPLAELITPNIPEAEILCGFPIHSTEEMVQAVQIIANHHKSAVLIKGGHLPGQADDLLFESDNFHWFKGLKIDNPNTHGTGCTLSSAIACNLATGYNLVTSIQRAKDYITGAIAAGLDLGSGNGPLNHCYLISVDA